MAVIGAARSTFPPTRSYSGTTQSGASHGILEQVTPLYPAITNSLA